MTGRCVRFDARPGRSYRLVLYNDGSLGSGKATADSDIEIVRNVRVVQAVDFVSDDPAFAGTMTLTCRWRLPVLEWRSELLVSRLASLVRITLWGWRQPVATDGGAEELPAVLAQPPL
jgi:hypothetical protein